MLNTIDGLMMKNKKMKYLIFFLAVISLPLFAQKKKNIAKIVDMKIQITEWMAKISSDPEMREAMLEMILDSTRGNKAEMKNFCRAIINNVEMSSIIADMLQRRQNNNNIPVKSLSPIDDSTNTMSKSAYILSGKK